MFTSLKGLQVPDSPDLTKHHFRTKVWKYLEVEKIARFPLPVHGRIPNFEDSSACGPKVVALPEFTSSTTIKINLDKPQEEVRYLALQARKRVLVPSPRLKTGLFNLLEYQSGDDNYTVRQKAQSIGVRLFSKPVNLDSRMKVDLIVIGSTAVSLSGRRIGKGEGFADLEYAMMRTMETIDENTTIITTVHDCQVFDDLPDRIFQEYDVPVDIIVTPTCVINVPEKLPRPKAILWHLLTYEKFSQFPILKTLRQWEKEKGVDVILADYEEDENGLATNEVSTNQSHIVSSDSKTVKSKSGFKNRSYVNQSRYQKYPRPPFDGQPLKNVKNIQVTIRMNKENRIVGRNVETCEESDHIATTKFRNGAGAINRRMKNHEPWTFVVFVGGIPRRCRVSEFKAELSKRLFRHSVISWSGKGYAFLNFHCDVEEAREILKSLEGITIENQLLTIEVAKDCTLFVGKDDKETETVDVNLDGEEPLKAEVAKKKENLNENNSVQNEIDSKKDSVQENSPVRTCDEMQLNVGIDTNNEKEGLELDKTTYNVENQLGETTKKEDFDNEKNASNTTPEALELQEENLEKKSEGSEIHVDVDDVRKEQEFDGQDSSVGTPSEVKQLNIDSDKRNEEDIHRKDEEIPMKIESPGETCNEKKELEIESSLKSEMLKEKSKNEENKD